MGGGRGTGTGIKGRGRWGRGRRREGEDTGAASEDSVALIPLFFSIVTDEACVILES